MSFLDDFTGKNLAEAATGAAGTQADAERQALAYLMQREAIPVAATEKLGGLAGLTGEEGVQQGLIDRAKASPLYSAITGTIESGEEAALGQASATGMLRSGNIKDALAKKQTAA